MLEYRTQDFNGYAVKYSPFFDSRIAVASSQHFGLVGNGRLFVLGLTPKGIVAEKWYLQTLPLLLQNAFTLLHLPRSSQKRPGSTRKIPSSTSPGPKRTRTKS